MKCTIPGCSGEGQEEWNRDQLEEVNHNHLKHKPGLEQSSNSHKALNSCGCIS